MTPSLIELPKEAFHLGLHHTQKRPFNFQECIAIPNVGSRDELCPPRLSYRTSMKLYLRPNGEVLSSMVMDHASLDESTANG